MSACLNATTSLLNENDNDSTVQVISCAKVARKLRSQLHLVFSRIGYTSASIAKATLKLCVNAVTTAGGFNVDFVNRPFLGHETSPSSQYRE